MKGENSTTPHRKPEIEVFNSAGCRNDSVLNSSPHMLVQTNISLLLDE